MRRHQQLKPLLAIMGLNEGAITPYYRYFGGATFQIPGTAVSFVTGDAAVMAGWMCTARLKSLQTLSFTIWPIGSVSTRSTNT